MMAEQQEKDLSYFHRPPVKPYIYQTIPDRIEQWVKIQPDKPALIARYLDRKREVITYAKLVRYMSQLAKQLLHLGIQRGDRVAVVVQNSVAWAIAEFGVMTAGAVAVNLMPSDALDSLRSAMSVGCVTIILDSRHVKSKEEFDNLAVALVKQGNVQGHGAVNIILIHDEYLSDTCKNFKTLIESQLTGVMIPNDIDPDDVCSMFATSGSTGKSKFIQHSHMGLINGAVSIGKGLGIRSTDVDFSDRSMGYAGGYPLHLLSLGITGVYVDMGSTVTARQTNFVIDVMKEEGVTTGFIPPYLLFDLLKAAEKGFVLPSLRTCHTTGQTITKYMMDDFKTFVQVPYYMYGMTEMVSAFLFRYEDTTMKEEWLGGYPTEGLQVKVLADDNTLVPFGVEGEIFLRGLCVTRQYVIHDGSVVDSLDQKGWLSTGDIGILRSDGYLLIRGRKKDMIKRATVKIFPAAIEAELEKHPDVDRVIVVAIPDNRLFEEVCACIVLKAGCYIRKESLADFASSVFSPSSAADGKGLMPGYFLILNDIPMLPSGKPDKTRLTGMAVCQLGL